MIQTSQDVKFDTFRIPTFPHPIPAQSVSSFLSGLANDIGMIPTPDLSHLNKSDYVRVYEPAEDSFILLDALEADAQALCASSLGFAPLCVEIGSGSGIVSAFLASIVGSNSAFYIGVDLNTEANRCTVATGRQNGVYVEAVRSSLLTGLQQRIKGKVDVLLFNPPYVPTEEEEESFAQRKADIEGAWAGGWTGTKLVDSMIADNIICQTLSPGGRFYLVSIRQNDPPALVQRLVAQGLEAQVSFSRTILLVDSPVPNQPLLRFPFSDYPSTQSGRRTSSCY